MQLRIGGPRVRWEDDVREDLGKMKIQNRIKMAGDRETGKRIVEQAKTRKEFYRQEENNMQHFKQELSFAKRKMS